MLLNLKMLRDKGWKVEVDRDTLTIYGDTMLPFVAEWVEQLQTIGISRREAEFMTDDLAMTAEQRLILRDGGAA